MNKAIVIEKEELTRCIKALFGTLKKENFNDATASVALYFMLNTFKAKGYTPLAFTDGKELEGNEAALDQLIGNKKQ